MILFDLKNRPRKIYPSRYKINWDKQVGSNAQFQAKQFIKPYWIGDSVCEEFIIPGSRLRVDLINFSRKIAIEISGSQHENYTKFFHKNRLGFIKSIKRDFEKIKWLELNEFTLVEIYDHEVPLLTKDFFEEKFNMDL